RVMKGDATGYAYAEDLSSEAMEHAARTAAQIADHGTPHPPVGLASVDIASRYPVLEESMDVEGAVKRELLARADRAARAADARIIRVDAGISESVREILVVTSDGK